MSDAILLDIELACIVGILPRERVEPQPLQIRLEMGIDLDACGTSGNLDESVNYADVDAQVRFLCTEGRFRLIEVLGTAILRAILAPPSPGEARAPLAWAEVEILKPTVLRSAVPGVRMRRDAEWAAGQDVLADVEEVRAERTVVQAGTSIAGPGRALLPDGRTVTLPHDAGATGAILVVSACDT